LFEHQLVQILKQCLNNAFLVIENYWQEALRRFKIIYFT
jgi:hypothetical protein